MIHVIIDINLKKIYQVKLDWQEWIIVMKYIYINETFILSLIIFKRINLYKNWIIINILNDWYFSCNIKRWISNKYDVKWMK